MKIKNDSIYYKFLCENDDKYVIFKLNYLDFIDFVNNYKLNIELFLLHNGYIHIDVIDKVHTNLKSFLLIQLFY